MNQAERRSYLIHTLLSERPSCRRQEIPKDAARQRVLLRGLMNVRPAKQISPEFLSVQDEYLRQELSEAGVTHVEDLQPVSGELYLWQGDITKLSCGAIVNAANSGLTGCYVPNHACIDNCHPHLRRRAAPAAGYVPPQSWWPRATRSPTGQAQLTAGVQPAVPGCCSCTRWARSCRAEVTRQKRTGPSCSRSCYRSCLALAAEHGRDERGLLLHLHGRVPFPERAGGRDRNRYGAAI